MIVGAVKYNDEFGADELRIETTKSSPDWSEKYLWYDSSTSISNYFNTSTGFFNKDFIDSGTEIHSNNTPSQYNKEMYIYSLYHYTKYASSGVNIVNVTNSQIYGRCLYHATGSKVQTNITGYEDRWVLLFTFDYVYTRWPKTFSSSYTLYSNAESSYNSTSTYPWSYAMGQPTKWNEYDMYRAKISYGEFSTFKSIGTISNAVDGGFVFVPDSAKYIYEGYHI